MRVKLIMMSWHGTSILVLCAFCVASCTHFFSNSETKKRAGIFYAQGTGDLVNKRYTSALKHLLEAVRLTPRDSRVHNNLGMTYYFKDQRGRALHHLNRAVELDKKNSEAHNNLASLYLEKGNLQRAEEHYLKVAEDLLYEHQYRTRYNLAVLYMRRNDPAKAQAQLLESLRDKADYCPALYQLGLIASKRENWLLAEERFKNSIRGACYSLPAPHFQLGRVWVRMGEHEKARDKFKKIVEKFPRSEYELQAKAELVKLERAVLPATSAPRLEQADDSIPAPLNF